jgi:hypothetical protein
MSTRRFSPFFVALASRHLVGVRAVEADDLLRRRAARLLADLSFLVIKGGQLSERGGR